MPDLHAVPDDQIGMDERVVIDEDLSKLLEKRLRAADDRKEIGKVYKAADVAAKEGIGRHQIDEGTAIRVGRFRIAKRSVASRHVEFDADETSRINISLWDKG